MDDNKYKKMLKESMAKLAEAGEGISDLEAAYMAGRLDAMLDIERLREVNNDYE